MSINKAESTTGAVQSNNQVHVITKSVLVQSLAGASRVTPVSGKDLSSATGLEERELRLVVEELRRDGSPICSDRHGYWLASDKKDLEVFLKSYRSHALSRLKTAHRMRRSYETRNQESMNIFEKIREEYDSDQDNV